MELIIFVNICNNTYNSQNVADNYSHYLKNKPKSKLNFDEIILDSTLSIIDGLNLKTSCGIGDTSNKTLK